MNEMFLNLMFEPSIRQHTGVVLSKRFLEEGGCKLTAYWEIMLIGFATSLYFATNDMVVNEEVVRGIRFNINNVFVS